MRIPFILLLVASSATAVAQTATPDSAPPSWAPAPGAHIRGYVLRPDSTAVAGWVVRYDHAFAAIASCARCLDVRWVPIDSVLALEQAHGSAKYRGSRLAVHVAKTTGLGAAVGAGIGVIALLTNRCQGDMCGLEVLAVPLGAIAGTGVGLVAGVVSGLVAKRPAWTPVQRP